MSWYWIVLLVIFYIVMWPITSIAFTRWAKNSDTGWLAVGALWPLILCAIPFVFTAIIIEKIVNKYGYKKNRKSISDND